MRFDLPNGMMRYGVLTILLFLLCLPVAGQSFALRKLCVYGFVVDASNHERMQGALVQLLSVKGADSTVVDQWTTDSLGVFTTDFYEQYGPDRYYLRFAYMGYYMQRRLINVRAMQDTIRIDTIRLKPSDVILKSAFVKGHRGKFRVVGDTVVFNPQAFHLDVGARMDELMEQLPGVQIRDGKYYWLGKRVEIVFNGEQLFKDGQNVLNSLPAEAVENVKAYRKEDKTADQTLTGRMVLDIQVKKKWMDAWYGNVRVGGGDHRKYVGAAEATHLSKHFPTHIQGNINNIGEQANYHNDFSYTQDREPATQQAINGQTSFTKVLGGTTLSVKTGATYSHVRQDMESGSSSETYLSDTTSQFRVSRSRSVSRSTEAGAEVSTFLMPGSGKSSLTFSGEFHHSERNMRTGGHTAMFNLNPYRWSDRPEQSDLWPALLHADSLLMAAVNSSVNQSYGTSHANSLRMTLNYMYTFNDKNSLRINPEFSSDDTHSQSFDRDDITYFKNPLRPSELSNLYSRSPNRSYNASVEVTWEHTWSKQLTMTMGYLPHYNYGRNEYSLYRLDRLADGSQWGLGALPVADSLSRAYDVDNSSLSSLRAMEHQFSWEMSWRLKSINLTTRLEFASKREHLDYRQGRIDTTAIRTTAPVTPSLRASFAVSKAAQMSLSYRFETEYPQLSQTIPYVNRISPLYTMMGNPDLKPSHTHSLGMDINASIPKHEQTLYGSVNYRYRTLSSGSVYRFNSVTGGSTFQPENVKGGFSVNESFNYQRSFGERISMKTETSSQYTTLYDKISVGSDPEVHQNSLRELSLRGSVALTYSYAKLNATLRGSVDYDHVKNILQPESGVERTDLGCAFEGKWRTPWADFKTSFTLLNRYGYVDPSMNKLRKLWNLSAERKVFKGNGTVTLAFTDIFHDLTNNNNYVTGAYHIEQWSDMAVNYFLVTFRYNLEQKH